MKDNIHHKKLSIHSKGKEQFVAENQEIIHGIREIKSDVKEIKKFMVMNNLPEKDEQRKKEITEWDRIQAEDEEKFSKFKKNVKNTEIKDPHPAVVISNDIQNKKSSRITKGKVLCDQIKNIDKQRIIKHLGTFDLKTRREVERKVLEGLELVKSLRGVGKSTLARVLATEATKKKIKTLLADCDHQQKTRTLEIAKRANLIIQPVGASRDDLLPALREFNALKAQEINKNKLLFILNHLSTPAEVLATQEYLTESGYPFAPFYLYEKASYRQAQSEGKSISEVNFPSLKKQVQKKRFGEIPQEISENIKAPETAPSDKRISGRTKQLNFKVREEFYWQLKNRAVEEKCLMVEILEKALECYEREKEVQSKKS
ncbi:9894_t:CDS:2 [Funneliformis geosporum]|nr:9894_t:CDS:2 [Funneliformis geosporum]